MRGRAAVAAVLLIAATGCSSGNSSTTSTPPSGAQAQPVHVTATHWWSASDYCGILSQTVDAGHSIFSGVQPGDPQMVAASSAFIAAVQKSAPAATQTQWAVLGTALLDLMKSGGKPSAVRGVDPQGVARAAAVIAADAKARCSLTLGS